MGDGVGNVANPEVEVIAVDIEGNDEEPEEGDDAIGEGYCSTGDMCGF